MSEPVFTILVDGEVKELIIEVTSQFHKWEITDGEFTGKAGDFETALFRYVEVVREAKHGPRWEGSKAMKSPADGGLTLGPPNPLGARAMADAQAQAMMGRANMESGAAAGARQRNLGLLGSLLRSKLPKVEDL